MEEETAEGKSVDSNAGCVPKTEENTEAREMGRATGDDKALSQVSPKSRSIEPSTWEAYLFGCVSMLSSFLPVGWVKGIFALVLLGVGVDIVWRAPLPLEVRKASVRAVLAVLLFGAWSYMVGASVQRAKLPLEVRFLDPKFLPWWKELEVRWMINDYHSKLADLGIPVSSEVPLIGGYPFTGQVFPKGITFESGKYPWEQIMRIDPRSKIHSRSIASAYLWFALERYIGTDSHLMRESFVISFQEYFGCSFSNDDTSCKQGLARALWEIRERYGSRFSDRMVANALIGLHEGLGDDPRDPTYRLLQMGCAATYSDDGTRMKEISGILTRNGLRGQ